MYEYKAQVIRVIDGDTVEVNIDLGFRMSYKTKMRLALLNAFELKTAEGLKAKARVEELTLNKPNTMIYSKGFDKYGRVLGIVYVNGESVNAQLLNEGLAVKA